MPRSPCGSGVTSRVAVLHAKQLIVKNQACIFKYAATGSEFIAKVVDEVDVGSKKGVIVEVKGRAFYTGKSSFIVEEEDKFMNGFIP